MVQNHTGNLKTYKNVSIVKNIIHSEYLITVNLYADNKTRPKN